MAGSKNPDLTTIGGRLQSERLRLGMTPTIMADIGGITKERLAGWEGSSDTESTSALRALAQAGLDVLFVITGKSTPHTLAGATARDALAALPKVNRHRLLIQLLAEELDSNADSSRSVLS